MTNGAAILERRNVVFVLEFLGEERLIVIADLGGDCDDVEVGGGEKRGGVGYAQIGHIVDNRLADVLLEDFDEVRVRIRAERDDVVYAQRENVGRGNLL